jgi:glycerol-3-phosphate dehydrogenase
VRRFGGEAPAVAALADGDPELLAPIADGVPALGAEVLWAMAAEGALDADDVLDARLRLDLVPAWRAAAEAHVAERVPAAAVAVR